MTSPIVLDRHLAQARRRIALRYRINIHADNEIARALRPPTPRWWETEPHCTDPAWRVFVARAIEEHAWRCNVEPAWLRLRAADSPLIADTVLADAARMLHEFARGAA